MAEHIWWYLARSAGMVTLALTAAAVIWGLLLSTRLIRNRSLPKWLLDLHRFLGGLGVLFLALHLGALIADSTVRFTAADLLVPLHSQWRPVAVAWGVVAAYLIVAVEVTSLAKRHLPRRVWARVHMSSFVVYVLSIVHAATAGTDASNRVFVVTAFVTSTVVVFLVLVRLIASRAARTRSSSTPRRVPDTRPASHPQQQGASATWS